MFAQKRDDIHDGYLIADGYLADGAGPLAGTILLGESEGGFRKHEPILFRDGKEKSRGVFPGFNPIVLKFVRNRLPRENWIPRNQQFLWQL